MSPAETFTMAVKLVLGVALLYAVLAVGGHYLSLLLIFPRPPVTYQLNEDHVQLTASDGVKLAARHWPNPAAKFTALYLHGNYEDLGSVAEYIPPIVAAGYAVFALDYRQYGHSGGKSTEASAYADVELAYHYLRTTLGVPADRIIIFGYSLGSGPAVELALRQPAAGLVLQGAFLSTYRVKTILPLFPGDKFVNIAKVSRLELPVLVIHGTADRTVPAWHSVRLLRAIRSRKSQLFIEGGPHTRLAEFTGPRYWEALKQFTDSL